LGNKENIDLYEVTLLVIVYTHRMKSKFSIQSIFTIPQHLMVR